VKETSARLAILHKLFARCLGDGGAGAGVWDSETQTKQPIKINALFM